MTIEENREASESQSASRPRVVIVGAALGVPLQRGGRIQVTPALHLPDDPKVWVIGDLAYLESPEGKLYPQLATVAMQQGRHVASNILSKLQGRHLQPFRYTDSGDFSNTVIAFFGPSTSSGTALTIRA